MHILKRIESISSVIRLGKLKKIPKKNVISCKQFHLKFCF